jgi:hypothetical protein
MQQQTQEPVNFNVNYHSGITVSASVGQYDTKEQRMMARERVGHPPVRTARRGRFSTALFRLAGGPPFHSIQTNAVEFPGAALSPQARVRSLTFLLSFLHSPFSLRLSLRSVRTLQPPVRDRAAGWGHFVRLRQADPWQSGNDLTKRECSEIVL